MSSDKEELPGSPPVEEMEGESKSGDSENPEKQDQQAEKIEDLDDEGDESQGKSQSAEASQETSNKEESEDYDGESSLTPPSKRLKTDSEMSTEKGEQLGSPSAEVEGGRSDDSENPDDPSPVDEKGLNSSNGKSKTGDSISKFNIQVKKIQDLTDDVEDSEGRSSAEEESQEASKKGESKSDDEASFSLPPPSKRLKTYSKKSSKKGESQGSSSTDEADEGERLGDSEIREDPSPCRVKIVDSIDSESRKKYKLKPFTIQVKDIKDFINEDNDRDDRPAFSSSEGKRRSSRIAQSGGRSWTHLSGASYEEVEDEWSSADSDNDIRSRKSSNSKSGKQEKHKRFSIKVRKIKDLTGEADDSEEYDDGDEFNIGLKSAVLPSRGRKRKAQATVADSSSATAKGDAMKYVILDKTKFTEMVEKGLIQSINNQYYCLVDGKGSHNMSYRPILPKTKPNILRRDPKATVNASTSEAASSSGMQNLPIITSVAGGAPVAISSSVPENQAGGLTLQMPTSVTPATPGLNQVINAPVYIKTPGSNQIVAAPGNNQIFANPGNMQVIPLTTALLNQVQKSSNLHPLGVKASTPNEKTAMKTYPASTQKSSSIKTSSSNKSQNQDGDDQDLINLSDSEDGVDTANNGAPVEDGSNTSNVMNSTPSISYLIVPNNPASAATAKPDGGSKSQPTRGNENSIVANPRTNVAVSTSVNSSELEDRYSGQQVINLRLKYREQLVYHRKRYSELLVTYNQLASRYAEVKDVGSVRQIMTDAKKHMKRDHHMFFRNEMLLRDRNGTGHRYSPKFMSMLLKYYNRSPIGFRFLRQIFTLPAVRTLLNWQSKSKHPPKKTKPKKSRETNVEANNEDDSEGSCESEEGPSNTVAESGLNNGKSDPFPDSE